MKNLKKILLSLLIASSMGAISTVAFAEASDGRIVYSPGDALDLIDGKVLAAIDGISKGADPEEAQKLIKAALDATKELNANDKVDMARQRANNKLKAAKGHAKAGSLQEAEQEVRDAHKIFQEMRNLL
jgi:hypothetical protein